jgi:hypothetical protein
VEVWPFPSEMPIPRPNWMADLTRYIRHRHQVAYTFSSNLYHLDETSVSTR